MRKKEILFMNYEGKINQVINLKVLNITHSLNLTSCVFGVCQPDGQVLENSYGLQLNCPWVLRDIKDGQYIAASGDYLGSPRDLGKITGDKAKWFFSYTLLDENLERIRKKELFVKEINISKHGDLKVVFSEQIELYTFTDFSCEKEGWWLYKCGDGYKSPLQKKGILAEKLITAVDSWWLIINRRGDLLCSDNTLPRAEKVQIDDQVEPLNKSENQPPLLTEMLGGTLIEIGRKKVDMLQEAPTSWLKIRVGDQGKENRIVSIYLDCPWRICSWDREDILIATADIKGDCLWSEDAFKPILREKDYYDEKVQALDALNLHVTGAALLENGNIILEFGEQYYFQSFISHSGDPIIWRMYCSGTDEYYQGGNGFTEHLMREEIVASRSSLEDVNCYLQ